MFTFLTLLVQDPQPDPILPLISGFDLGTYAGIIGLVVLIIAALKAKFAEFMDGKEEWFGVGIVIVIGCVVKAVTASAGDWAFYANVPWAHHIAMLFVSAFTAFFGYDKLIKRPLAKAKAKASDTT